MSTSPSGCRGGLFSNAANDLLVGVDRELPRKVDCRTRFSALAALSLLLSIGPPNIVYSASDAQEPWAKVAAELQEPLEQAAAKISKSLEATLNRVSHTTDGNVGLADLPRQPYVTSSGVSWFLPGVDKDGKQVPPKKKGKRRPRAYGDAHFSLSLVQVYGLTPEKLLEKMLEGRKLSEARQRLQTQGFQINYDLKEKEIPEAKKTVHDPLIAQAEQLRKAHRQKTKPILESADALKDQRDRGIESCRERKRALHRSHRAAELAFKKTLPSYNGRGGYSFEDLGRIRKFKTPRAEAERTLERECGDKAHKLLREATRLENSVYKQNAVVYQQVRELRGRAKKAYREAVKNLRAKAKDKLAALDPKLDKIEKEQRDRNLLEQADALAREEVQVKNRFGADANCMLGAAQTVLEEYRTASAVRAEPDNQADQDPLTRSAAECNPQARLKMKVPPKKKAGKGRDQVAPVENPRAETTRQALQDLLATEGGRRDPRLKSSVERFEKDLGFFAQQTATRLQDIGKRKEKLEKARVDNQERVTRKRTAPRRFPQPYELLTRTFESRGEKGAIFELKGAIHGRDRGRRAVSAYWPCGPYLARASLNLRRPVMKTEKAIDGNHKWVPFRDERLDQVESFRKAAVESLNASGMCDRGGYWSWTEKYAAKAEGNKAAVEGLKAQLGVLAKEKEDKRQQWLELMIVGLEMALPGDGTTILGKRSVTGYKRLRDGLRAETRKIHDEQRALIQEAAKLLEEQLTLLEEQAEKSKDTRPQVRERLEAFKNERQMTRVELYDIAQWYEPTEFPVILAEYEENLEALKVEEEDARWQFVEWMRAKWLLARAQKLDERIRLQRPVHDRMSGSAGTWYKTGRILDKPSRAWDGDEAKELGNPLVLAARTARQDAILKLRVLLEKDPENLAVQHTLRQEEKAWLRRIAAKLEVEKRASLDSFNQYLSNRGYDPTATETDSPWWEGFKDYLGYAWGAGPITSLTSIPGAPLPFGLDSVFPNVRLPGTSIPGSQAEATDHALTRNAKHQIAMFAIMRLHGNGVPLEKISEVAGDAKKLAEEMVLKNSGGAEMSAEKASKLAKDIRQTFSELADLRALTLGDMDRFNKALAKSHYPTIDVQQSWSEFLGDALSPRHLLTMAAPSAVIVKSGGRFVWTARSSQIKGLVQGGGKAATVREHFVASLQLEKIGKWFERGWIRKTLKKAVASPFIKDQQMVARLKGWDRFVNGGSRVFAAMVIMGGGIHLAHQHGGVGGLFVAEVLASLTAHEIAYDFLSRSGTPLRKLAGQVDEFGLVVVKKQARLADLQHVLDDLNALTKAKPSTTGTKDLGEKALRQADEELGTAVTKAVPDTAEQGLDHAIAGAVAALRKGDVAEAKAALKAAEGFTDRLGKELPALKAKVDKAKAVLEKAKRTVRSVSGKEKPAGKLKSLDDQGMPAAFIVDERLYDLPVSGRFLDKADDAFQRGDMGGAIRYYRRARRWAKKHDQSEMAGVLDDRLALAAGTEKAGGILFRMRKRIHTIEADKTITDGEIKELIEQFQKGSTIKPMPGGTSPVYEFTDKRGRRYVFKQLGDSEEMAAETAASRLAQALGIKAPTARRVRMGKVKAIVEENGKKVTKEIEAEGVLYRHIEGEKLSDLTEPVAAALKGDYAKQRVLRAWLADPDIHFGNHLLGGDAHLWALDFGRANLKRKQLVKILKQGDGYAEYGHLTPEKYIDFILGLPHLDSYRKLPQYGWMARMDDMIHYQDMVDTLKLVKKLVDGDGRELRAILEKSLPKSQVDEAFEVLRERAKHLEAAMLKRFSRPSVRLTKRAGRPVTPWTVREGEGLLPHTAAEARPGKPMVLDPEVSKTYLYVVKEDGSIVYAPQSYGFQPAGGGRFRRVETVKHTDLAEAGPAKIGGEIKFKEGVWYMDNLSGRYSAAPDATGRQIYGFRTKEELEAAVELARRSGTQQTIEAKFR